MTISYTSVAGDEEVEPALVEVERIGVVSLLEVHGVCVQLDVVFDEELLDAGPIVEELLCSSIDVDVGD